jgi:hypothetical protein
MQMLIAAAVAHLVSTNLLPLELNLGVLAFALLSAAVLFAAIPWKVDGRKRSDQGCMRH